MNNEDKKQNFDLDPNYATKQELNYEATIRAENDVIITNEVNIKLKEEQERIDDFGEQLTEAEDKITEIEGFFWDKIKELEAEVKELNFQLEDANKIIAEKDVEIKKLREELQNNGHPNEINLGFSEVLEFEINEVISVKQFINNNLKDLVISKMIIRYPESELGKDYAIVLNGLDYLDVMQGKDVIVTVSALAEGNLIGASSFAIKVNYSYDVARQEKFAEEFLQSTIPVSLRNISENASPNYNVQEEIIETKPLKLLLHDQKFDILPFKVFAEMNAGSYWTDFHRNWNYITDGYNGTGQSTIGTNKIINSINDLYNNTSGYYQKIFDLIEQRLNDSGVACTITKKWARTSNGDRTLHTLGNLTFNVANANLDDDEILVTQNRQYYLMINFELNITNGLTKFYRGVTLALTDNLELY